MHKDFFYLGTKDFFLFFQQKAEKQLNTQASPWPVLWMGIVLMPIRIRIQIRLSNFDADPDMDPYGSYPKFYTSWKIRKNIDFYSQLCQSLVYTFKYVV